ncbi:MAG: hypothetical protein U1D06_04245 [Paracoccaceae bacterium]|nr:hypothetical protein [Paracoccaceae bacterium]
MNDIAKLEGRITAALERIGTGLDRLGDRPALQANAGSADRDVPADLAALHEALEAEKTANAQLTERLRAVKDRDAQSVQKLEARIAVMTRQLDVQGLEMQRMRKTTIQLREHLRSLHEAVATGEVDPHLVNKSMLVELEALRTVRSAEAAEIAEILAELTPLVQEVQINA